MPTIYDVEAHQYTFPILLSYSVLVTLCGFYYCCKSCCSKHSIMKSINPRITLSSA